MEPAVPHSPKEITKDWLLLVLNRSFPNLTIRSICMQRIGVDFGLASNIYCCSLDSNSIASVVVKIWPIQGYGAAEIDFYKKIAPKMNLRVPKCYYAAADASWGVLVLENCSNVVQGNCLEQLELDKALAVADLLAELHASWWQTSKLDDLSWLPCYSDQRTTEWFSKRIRLVLDRFAEQLEPETRSLIANAEKIGIFAKERLAKAPTTLIHSDLHLDNFLFETTGKPILLDWACIKKGPAVLDLSEILLMGKCADSQQIYTYYRDGLARRGNSTDLDLLEYLLEGALMQLFIKHTLGIAQWYPASVREEKIIILTLQRIQDLVLPLAKSTQCFPS